MDNDKTSFDGLFRRLFGKKSPSRAPKAFGLGLRKSIFLLY